MPKSPFPADAIGLPEEDDTSDLRGRQTPAPLTKGGTKTVYPFAQGDDLHGYNLHSDPATQRGASESQMPSPAALEAKGSTKSASPVLATSSNLRASRIPAGKSATILTERRGFLRALAGLPFIGGAVALIGQPTAVAEPVTLDLLEAYKVWLSEELSYLAWEMASRPECIARYGGENAVERSRLIRSVKFNVGEAGHWHDSMTPNPSSRAALVLSTVGCEWKEGR